MSKHYLMFKTITNSGVPRKFLWRGQSSIFPSGHREISIYRKVFTEKSQHSIQEIFNSLYFFVHLNALI